MPLKIAFVGKKAAGKTFAAFYLQKRYKFLRKPLREPLRKFLRTIYYYGDYKRVSWEQELGFYDALYKLDPNIWITHLKRRLNTSTSDIVVEDARYINEVQALKDMGFILIRINAPESLRKRNIGKSLLDAAENSVILAEYFHKDLTSLYRADYTLLNEDKESTRKALDIIISKETSKLLDNGTF